MEKYKIESLVPHHNNPGGNKEIQVSWTIDEIEKYIEFNFKVHDYDYSSTSNLFDLSTWNNVGLWEYDVIEVFITRGHNQEDKLPYLEVQCSPLNQKFGLIVNRPRVETSQVEELNTKFEIITQNPWVTRVIIPFSDIPGSGNILYGNCFSCLGNAKNRQYYALNINKDDNPDYHRPELFLQFGEINN